MQPYNWVGNWFSTIGSESKVYSYTEIPSDIPRLYIYKIKKDFEVFNITEENNLVYLLINIAFMKTKIDHTNSAILSIVKYARATTSSGSPMLQKYNYTLGKNLLNKDGTSQYGLYDSSNETKISDEFEFPINIASYGDADKPLAGAICNAYNSEEEDSLKVIGWYINFIDHLMICNPNKVLENTSGYIFVNEPDEILIKKDEHIEVYDDLLKKYQKYKAKYLKLKKLLKN